VHGGGAGDALELTYPWRLPATADYTDGVAMLKLDLEGDTRDVKRLDRGLTLTTWEHRGPDGPRRMWLLTLKRDQLRRLKVVPASSRLRGLKPLPELGRGAAAALNGGFFDPQAGVPVGALAVAGEWITRPIDGRTALVLPADGPPRITALQWLSEVQTPLLQLPVQSFNQEPTVDAGACAVLTRRWDGPSSFAGLTATPLAGQGVVIQHQAAFDDAPVVVIRTEPPTTAGAGGDTVLGAGPCLVRGGRVKVTAEAEHFKPDVTAGVTARAAVGLTADGSLLLAYGQGGPPDSRGFGLAEWAQMLRQAGAREALNLDGGPSAQMVVGGRLVAGRATPVADALVIAPP